MAQEIEEDKGFLQSTADFFKNVDYKQLAEESIPIVGENIIIGDIKENLKEGSLGSAALNTGALALGTVPIIGDLAAKPLRALASKYQKARKKVDNIKSKEEWQKQIETLKTEERATTGRDPTGRTLDLEEQAGKFIDETKESQLNTYTFKAKVTAPTRQGGKAKMAKSGLSFDVPIRARTEEEARILLRQHPEVVKRKKRIDEREIPMDETAKSRLVVDEVYMTGFSDDAIIDAGLDTVENVKAKQKARRSSYIDEVQKKRPITEWRELPHETTDKALVFSLNDGQIKNGSFILPERMATKLGVSTAKIKEGAKVMGRLDIPAYKRYDTWIVTNTVAGQKGSVYSKGLHYTSKGDAPISFRASQAQGEKIGTGQAEKIGYATIVGAYKSTSPEQIRKLAQKYLNDPKWTQVGFDPRKLGSFYTRNLKGNYPVGTAVTGADEVLQLGPLVLAKNVKVDLDYVGYNEGGPVMALEEQTEMAFRDKPPRVDPVSGNEVPPGALPSEVRDDIPARLSEGEYVVPADVLQYFGIKFFEDLRSKAKTDLAGLEENGRMGGEPVDDGEDLLFSAEELNTYEDSEPVAANMGGMISGYEEGGVTEMQPIGPQSVLKTYINDDGQRLFIRFVNGVAVPPVPPGYREEGTSSPTSDTTPTTPTGSDQSRDDSDAELQKGEPEIFPRNLDKMNAAQLAQYAAEISKTNVYKTVTRQPLIGFLARKQSKKVTDYLENQIKDVAKDSNMAEFYQALLDGIENGDRAGLEELVEQIKLNNPELNTKVLVSGSQISKDREKGSTVVDPLTNSNNTIGLGGTKYGTDISAAQERSFTMPGTTTTAQKDAATTGGTEVDATSKVDPFGIGSEGEFDTSGDDASDDGTSNDDADQLEDLITTGPINDDADQLENLMTTGPLDVTSKSTKEILEKRKNDATKALSTFDKYGFLTDRKLGDKTRQLETPATTKRDSLLNKVRSEAYTLTPFGALKNVITNIKEGFGTDNSAEDEGNVIKLLSEVNNNPENATAIIENITAQDSTALTSNLMSPRFGYESGRDDLQQRMVTGPGGVERLPLTDSQTLAAQESKIKAAENEYKKELAELEAFKTSKEAEITAARQEEAEEKEMSSERISERIERGRSGRGGFNKGGLASRKTKKKRKSK